MKTEFKSILKVLLIAIVFIVVVLGISIIFQGETLKKTNRAQEYLIERYKEDRLQSKIIIDQSLLREDSLLLEISILKAGIRETQSSTNEIIERINSKEFSDYSSISYNSKLDTLDKYLTSVNEALSRLRLRIATEHKNRQSIVHSE